MTDQDARLSAVPASDSARPGTSWQSCDLQSRTLPCQTTVLSISSYMKSVCSACGEILKHPSLAHGLAARLEGGSPTGGCLVPVLPGPPPRPASGHCCTGWVAAPACSDCAGCSMAGRSASSSSLLRMASVLALRKPQASKDIPTASACPCTCQQATCLCLQGLQHSRPSSYCMPGSGMRMAASMHRLP